MVSKFTSVHLCHSHLPSNVTKTFHYITSGPLYTYCVQYIFYIWSVWFCHQQLCELPVHDIPKVTALTLYSDHRDTALFRAGHQQRVTECTAVLETFIRNIFCILSHKWSCVSMECYHNLDKRTIQQLILQLSVIFNCIYISSHAVKVYQILPCECPHRINGFLSLVIWRQARSTQTVAAGIRNKPINWFYYIVSFYVPVSFWDYLVLVTDK